MHTIKPHKASTVRVTAELILAASEILDRPRRNGSGSFVMERFIRKYPKLWVQI